MNYLPTIGLEIHSELLTKTKMFCGCLNDETELTANKNICPVCMAHPGTLPVANKEAINLVIKTGLALNCAINKSSKFDRKNYFYPDLPKAYQISQYDLPLCKNGYLVLPESKKKIGITRIHLEEDTARLAHAADGKHSLVDFNRAGVPLMELVTEPDFHSAQEVVEFAQEFQLILRYLGVSDADMEKGHLRLEANISVAPQGSEKLGTKVEVKNLNSFQAVYKAVEYEIKRQINILELENEKMNDDFPDAYIGKTIHKTEINLNTGEEKKINFTKTENGWEGKIIQETRGWNEGAQQTFSQRSKEDAHDYRYFPDPDLPPMEFSDADIEAIRAQIAELPAGRRERLSQEYNLSVKQAELLVRDSFLCSFFEEAVSELKAMHPQGNVEMAYNYIASDLKGIEKDAGVLIGESHIKPDHIAHIVSMLSENKISSRVAKDVLRESFDSGVSPQDIVQQKGLEQVSDESALIKIIQEVLTAHAQVVEEYKKGKVTVLQFLVGQVMAKTKGAANPGMVRTMLEKELSQ